MQIPFILICECPVRSRNQCNSDLQTIWRPEESFLITTTKIETKGQKLMITLSNQMKNNFDVFSSFFQVILLFLI